MSNISIAEIVARYNLPADQKANLTAALVAREQGMADILRQAGMQFGLFPQIVAEVLAEVEMGEPIPEDQRVMVRQQFQGLMEQIAAAQRGEGPMPQP